MLGADTIAAIATAPGRGGIGVVRISGPAVQQIAQALLGRMPVPRKAEFGAFRDAEGEAIDRGIALYFEAPASYTGEDVLELQAHGGPIVLSMLLGRCTELGARLAEPGEFTRRALFNDKLDLAQAEAVADLIDAASESAVRSAMRSLAGEFSNRVAALQHALTDVRVGVEASFDFPEEDLDPEALAQTSAQLTDLLGQLQALQAAARTGKLLRDGIEVALIGPPNVGKSSIINAMAREEVAIVTPIAGTTRDLVRASIVVAGVPVHLTDTAGIHETSDAIESIGIARARDAARKSDLVLLVTEAGTRNAPAAPEGHGRLVHVHNKIDLLGFPPKREIVAGEEHLWISATEGLGLDLLAAVVAEVPGAGGLGNGTFSARQRHLDALGRVHARIRQAIECLHTVEFAAEELRLAQQDLSELTGEHAADDLLGAIFSRFCIGK